MTSFDPATVRQAVAEFTPFRPQKFQDLLPAKDVIAELRLRTLHRFRRVNGLRQVEIAELMVAANNYTTDYVEALILGALNNQLNSSEKPRKRKAVTVAKLGLLQQEMETLQHDLKAVESDYGQMS